MLTRIDVDSENAFYLRIAGVTPKDSLLVQKITGLNPPDVTLFMGDYARDGGNYQGRRVGNRNVVIIFDLNPNPALGETIEGLRDLIYKAFLDPLVDADYIKLNFLDDLGRTRYVVGYTEKIDNELFDVDTSMQVSIICPDPYIRDAVETVLTDATGWSTVPFEYTGSAETGFEADIYITSPTPALTLDNNGRTIVMTRDFFAGDVVHINTNAGAHAMTVTPDGEEPQSILASMDSLSNWIQLHSQSNVLKVYGATSTDLVAAVRSLSFRQAYWGV